MNRLPGFGVYVHWPFCRSKCPYCDFNSQPAARLDAADQEGYRQTLMADLEHALAAARTERIASVFFGGGTPSLMEPQTIDAVLNRLAAGPGLAADCEVTLEANPGTVTWEGLKALRSAGVTRLSIGMQSLNADSLRFLGRGHDPSQALAAYEMAGQVFDRLSMDYIYALPGQSPTAWQDELTAILALNPDHLSLYQLTIEPGTEFQAAIQRQDFTPLDPDEAALLYEVTQDLTEAAGLPAYEISNHARPGHECRHNRDIWRGGLYIGVGPGAHGRVRVKGALLATERFADPSQWTQHVNRLGYDMTAATPLTPHERAQELLLLGLRLKEGIDLARFQELSGLGLNEAVAPPALARLLAAKALVIEGNCLKIADNKRLILDTILRALLEPDKI
jgi:putative oxygen-independent coproporphyrinogen III oxidase